MSIVKKISGFLHLYRLDVCVIFFFLYFLGSYVAAGFYFNLPGTLLVAILISGISINFIYVLNSWSDADIDKINKPERPIPSNIVSKSQAFTYALMLLALSLAYPVILFGVTSRAALFLLFPLAGILYSNPVYSFKKRKYLALSLITATAFLVCFLGYSSNNGAISPVLLVSTCMFIASCVAIVPLKDLPDVEGDAAGNADNWFKKGGQRKRFFFSALFLAASAILGFLLADAYLEAITLMNLAYFLILLWVFHRFAITMKKFYRSLLLGIVLDAVVFCVWYALLHVGLFT